MVVEVISVKDTIKDKICEYTWDCDLSPTEQDELNTFVRTLEAAQTAEEVAAVLLSVTGQIIADDSDSDAESDIEDDDKSYSPSNFKTYLFKILSQIANANLSSYVLMLCNPEIAYNRAVTNLTGLQLPTDPIQITSEFVNKVLAVNDDLPLLQKKGFRALVDELKIAGKLVLGSFALLVTHVRQTAKLKAIKAALQDGKETLVEIFQAVQGKKEAPSPSSLDRNPAPRSITPLASFRKPSSLQVAALDLCATPCPDDSAYSSPTKSSSRFLGRSQSLPPNFNTKGRDPVLHHTTAGDLALPPYSSKCSLAP